MRTSFLVMWLTIGLVSLKVEAESTRLQQADRYFWGGQGKSALRLYQAIREEAFGVAEGTETSELKAAALEGILQVALRFGDHSLAEQTIHMITTSYSAQPRLLVLAGRYAEYRGRLAQAESFWRKVLSLNPNHCEARFRLAEQALVTTVSPERTAPYRWFFDQMNTNPQIPREDLEWIGRACVRLEKYEDDGAQKAYKQALDASPGLEAVQVAKGDLWFDRYDETNAITIYTEALKRNKESLPAWLGLAQTQREKGDFVGCRKALDQALGLNPHHPLALAMAADLAFYDQQYEEAESYLAHGYQTNPIEMTLLAVDATYALRRKQTERIQSVLERVRKAYTNPAEFYFQVADCLERNYLFREADEYHRLCLRVAPWHKRAYAARAMLYSRVSPASAETGLEVMRAAFNADPFHLRLFNMRNLFNKRAEFRKMESEHFLLRVPASGGRAYGEMALHILEETYRELCLKYQFQPVAPPPPTSPPRGEAGGGGGSLYHTGIHTSVDWQSG